MRSRSIITFVAALILGFTSKIAAHPLGNFSISQYSAIQIGVREIELRYIVDMAEIPTFQEMQETGLMPKADDENVQAYARRKAERLSGGLLLKIDGRPIALQPESHEIIFPEGAGGLPTLKIAVLYRGKLARDSGMDYSLNYSDGNFPGRAGWKEIIATAAPGVKLLSSSVAEADRSARLSDYPTGLLNSPPQQLAAQVSFTVAAPAERVANFSAEKTLKSVQTAKPMVKTLVIEAAQVRPAVAPAVGRDWATREAVELKPNRQTTPRSSFTEILARKDLELGVMLAALAIAVGLGALHALEPGHGKTLVAAYLVGSRGTFKHAFLLGVIVTGSHTAGVYLLGAITLYASKYIVPERLYPWLGALSGVLIASLGLILLVRRYRGRAEFFGHSHQHHDDHNHGAPGHNHHHAHDHAHAHHHHHGHEQHDGEAHRAVSLKQLLALGISGGIVPCPAALVVLLSALAMQRIGFGLLLIVAFSIGLAAVLIAVGMLMVYARQFMARFQTEGQWTSRWLPITSSAFILLAGIVLTWQALRSAGFLTI
jgi:ABC-type nickel/cobalt efflux system permease component RcnA